MKWFTTTFLLYLFIYENYTVVYEVNFLNELRFFAVTCDENLKHQAFTFCIFPSIQWLKKTIYFRQENYQHQPFPLFLLSVLHCAPAYLWEILHPPQSPSGDSHPERHRKISFYTCMQSIPQTACWTPGGLCIERIWVKNVLSTHINVSTVT